MDGRARSRRDKGGAGRGEGGRGECARWCVAAAMEARQCRLAGSPDGCVKAAAPPRRVPRGSPSLSGRFLPPASQSPSASSRPGSAPVLPSPLLPAWTSSLNPPKTDTLSSTFRSLIFSALPSVTSRTPAALRPTSEDPRGSRGAAWGCGRGGSLCAPGLLCPSQRPADVPGPPRHAPPRVMAALHASVTIPRYLLTL